MVNLLVILRDIYGYRTLKCFGILPYGKSIARRRRCLSQKKIDVESCCVRRASGQGKDESTRFRTQKNDALGNKAKKTFALTSFKQSMLIFSRGGWWLGSILHGHRAHLLLIMCCRSVQVMNNAQANTCRLSSHAVFLFLLRMGADSILSGKEPFSEY